MPDQIGIAPLTYTRCHQALIWSSVLCLYFSWKSEIFQQVIFFFLFASMMVNWKLKWNRHVLFLWALSLMGYLLSACRASYPYVSLYWKHRAEILIWALYVSRDIKFEYLILSLDLNTPSVTKTLVVIYVLRKQVLEPPVFSFASAVYGFYPIIQESRYIFYTQVWKRWLDIFTSKWIEYYCNSKKD